MGDTYTGDCKICGEETDLILGECEECSSASPDYRIGMLKGRGLEMERDAKKLRDKLDKMKEVK